jgi:spore coat protein U-like protein
MKTKLLSLIALATLAYLPASHAASSATLNLSGSIASSVSIAVSANATASNLTLTSNASDTQVATVSESSNSASGYSILAKSSNAGKLVNSADSSESIAYTIKYGSGSSLSLTAVDQTVKSQTTSGVYSSVQSALSISFTGASATSKLAGNYTDTITLTVQAI